MSYKIPRKKLWSLVMIVIVYALLGIAIYFFVGQGFLTEVPREYEIKERNLISSKASLETAQRLHIVRKFLEENMVEENKHVNLYYVPKESEFVENPNFTNSEAMSYYLLWNAKARNKDDFDKGLDYIEEYMMHPEFDYLRWNLNDEDVVEIEGGSNIASDADVRILKALFIAQEQWSDEKYEELIEKLINGLENVALTEDNHLAPYGGFENNELWTADEVWLSYYNFEVFRELAIREGNPWIEVFYNSKNAVLDAQLENGLYETQLNENREFQNELEEGYSINSLWIMVRASESRDQELLDSAKKSLNFYKQKYNEDGVLYTAYTAEGEPVKEEYSPGVYALVGRAAISLNDVEFSNQMIDELLKYQNNDSESELYGAIVEGPEDQPVVSQFTMQESILTLQEYLKLRYGTSG